MIENSRTYSFEDYLSALASMTKFKITIAVCTTTLVGFVLARKGIDASISMPALALFLVASGSAALNHFQEHHLDSRMGRTKGRMISSGMMSSWNVLGLAVLLISLGVGALYISAGTNPALLGVLALIWYNGIYTPLKRVSPFAVIPGGVIGMLPPLIGWNIGGGYLADPTILAFCFFIFIKSNIYCVGDADNPAILPAIISLSMFFLAKQYTGITIEFFVIAFGKAENPPR